jgi:hypothetical protein
MKRFRLIAIILILALSMITISSAATGISDTPTDGASIDEPYDYPIKPGTDEWWALPQTLEAKIAASQVPEDLLPALTTRALVETVLDYPLLVNMAAFDSLEAGFGSVLSYFNGLQELVTRSDAVEHLEAVIAETEATGILGTDEIPIENHGQLTRYFHTKIITQGIENINSPQSSSISLLSNPAKNITINARYKKPTTAGISLLYATVPIATPGGLPYM